MNLLKLTDAWILTVHKIEFLPPHHRPLHILSHVVAGRTRFNARAIDDIEIANLEPVDHCDCHALQGGPRVLSSHGRGCTNELETVAYPNYLF